MKTSTLQIEKPTNQLLAFVRKMQSNKEAQQKELKDNWNKYFSKKN